MAQTNGTTSCSVLVPARPGQSTIRVTGLIVTSDLTNAVVTIKRSTTETTVSTSNASTSATNIVVESTSGFASNDVVVLQTGGACYTATVWGTSQSTNLILTTGGFGVAVASGDAIGKLGGTVTLPICNCTVSNQGECVYLSASGKPIQVSVNGTAACSIDALTYKYSNF